MHAVRRGCVGVVLAVVASTLTIAGGTPVGAAEVAAPTDQPVDVGTFVVDEDRSFASDNSDPEWIDPTVTVPPAATVEVDVPPTGLARAGSLPVWVGRADSGASPARVRVRMLSQSEVAAVGGRFLGLELVRADGGAVASSVAVSLDYSGIAKAFGGNFGSRLRLVHAGPCAVDAPCSPTQIAVTNEIAAGRLLATSLVVPRDQSVATGPDAGSGFGPQESDPGSEFTSVTSGTYTVMSSASGDAGNYAATPLMASENWNVGVGSGAFTYSYPFKVPPAVAGPAPGLSLGYNSQAVDGRNAVENGQPSQVGEGWSFATGFIERKFHSCREEGIARDDLCWSAKNEYFLNFQGRSGELVRTGEASNEWRLRSDPAWRVLSFKACCANGDNDGEYFVLITPDGTKYWFGYGIEPRNTISPDTESTWTVPVYGGSGEPCYNPVAQASWCQQAWRWNVDRILDTNDNVTSLFYDKEKNRYSRHMTTTLSTQYDRSGYLTWIEYGQRHLAENGTAYARIEVTVGERCVTQVNCPAPSPSSTASSYPDVPLDRWCESLTACAADQTAPTFWSTKTYAKILTEITDVSPASYETVSIYRMSYSFPPTGNPNSSPSLWLTDIEHTGEWGPNATALPSVRMAGVAMQNRVNPPTGGDPIYKYRVTSISTELGARVEVTYGMPDPCPEAPSYPTWDSNVYDCYPVRLNGLWSPFFKYLVTDLKTVDVRGGGLDRNVHYTYAGAPAWHYADSVLAQQDNAPQSWSDYRGYEDVRVNFAGDGASEGTDTRYLLFRGMHGDKLENGGSKTETVTDSRGDTWNDYDFRGGEVAEVKTYDATDGHIASTVTRYWSEQTVNGPNGFQSHDARYVRPSQVFHRTKNLTTGAWRERLVSYTYDTTAAAPLTADDHANPGTGADDTCTKQAYTHRVTTGTAGGDTHWLVNAPYWTITYSGDCVGGTIIARNSIYYDNQAFQTAPVRGNVTQVSAYTGATAAAITKTGYDALGRVNSVISPGEVAAGTNGAATITYSPATGYPANGIKTKNVLGHQTTTVLYSGFGTPRSVTDANGDTTSITVDHLGRTTEVSRPGDSDGARTQKFEYVVLAGSHNKVTTSQLIEGTTYVKTYTYYDGLGRIIQTHSPDPNGTAGQSLITMTRYDTIGQHAAQTQQFASDEPAGTGLRTVDDLAQIPFESRYGYDESGRVYVATDYAAGVSKITNRTHHHGWHHTVDAPVHSDVDYHTDVFGRVTKIVERPAIGTITTNYAYTPLGDLDKITDTAGNITDFDYDWLRRRTQTDDPDQGVWNTTYTPDGDIDTVTDAENATLDYVYDRLRRKAEVYDGSTAGELLARWRYDDAAVSNAVGRLTESTSYIDGVDGTAYSVKVAGYDNRGRITGKQWVVPGFPTVTHNYDYNLADQVTAVGYPEVGGLPAETLTTARNAAGLPVRLTTSADPSLPIVSGTTYQDDGRVASRTMRGDVNRSFTYDNTTGRLSTVQTTAPIGGAVPHVIEDVRYGYDADHNVTSITDAMAGEQGTAQRECFIYDPLNRMTRAYTYSSCPASPPSAPASFGTDPYDISYVYDNVGNITSRSENGGEPIAYVYNGASPHAAMSIGGASYAYDNNGATTTRPRTDGAQTLTWNKLHQLESITGSNAASFVYDADGNRLIRATGGTTTLYIDDTEIRATPNGTGGTTYSAIRYYGGFAMRASSSAGSKVTVLLRNRQNSTSIAYDPDSDSATYQRYTPYGRRRGATELAATERRFLDKTEDPTDLVAMGARYYDPLIGRFISVDPLAVLTAPQSLAGYSYALGNPATLSDPSGLLVDEPSGGPCSAACETRYEVDVVAHEAATAEKNRKIVEIYTTEAMEKVLRHPALHCGSSSQAAVECYKSGFSGGGQLPSAWDTLLDVGGELSGVSDIADCEGWLGCTLATGMAAPTPAGKAVKGAKALKRAGNAAQHGDDAVKRAGDIRAYVDLTRPGAHARNVGTNATYTEFAETLIARGWSLKPSKDGAVQIFERDGAKYVLRDGAKSWGGWTADFTPAGAYGATLKIRLGYTP